MSSSSTQPRDAEVLHDCLGPRKSPKQVKMLEKQINTRHMLPKVPEAPSNVCDTMTTLARHIANTMEMLSLDPAPESRDVVNSIPSALLGDRWKRSNIRPTILGTEMACSGRKNTKRPRDSESEATDMTFRKGRVVPVTSRPTLKEIADLIFDQGDAQANIYGGTDCIRVCSEPGPANCGTRGLSFFCVKLSDKETELMKIRRIINDNQYRVYNPNGELRFWMDLCESRCGEKCLGLGRVSCLNCLHHSFATIFAGSTGTRAGKIQTGWDLCGLHDAVKVQDRYGREIFSIRRDDASSCLRAAFFHCRRQKEFTAFSIVDSQSLLATFGAPEQVGWVKLSSNLRKNGNSRRPAYGVQMPLRSSDYEKDLILAATLFATEKYFDSLSAL